MDAQRQQTRRADVDERSAAAPEGGAVWLRRIFVGSRPGTVRMLVLIVGFATLLTADAAVGQLTDADGLVPGLAPVMLGCLLVAVSHLLADRYRLERRALQITGNLAAAAGVVLVLNHWLGQ